MILSLAKDRTYILIKKRERENNEVGLNFIKQELNKIRLEFVYLTRKGD